jgi:hypothetical protein
MQIYLQNSIGIQVNPFPPSFISVFLQVWLTFLDRKHKARHERPWKCPDPDCKKHMCGFSTRNDLDRHLKSVHKMVTPNTKTTMYRCPFGQCKDIQKDWPRKDNFIQHLKRVHHLSEPIDVNHFSHQYASSSFIG